MSSDKRNPSAEHSPAAFVEASVEMSRAVVADHAPVSEAAENVLTGTGEAASTRFLLIDALRGVAAVGVVLYHSLNTTVMDATLRQALPRIVSTLSVYGEYGVQIFFVLSGFVIAHSLRRSRLTWPEIKSFILRRQIRLDPPYWASLLIILCGAGLERMVPALVNRPLPSLGAVLLNMAYVQDIVSAENINGVAWTLCYEVQFYLVFILLLRIGQRGAEAATAVRVTGATQALVFLLGVASLVFNMRVGYSGWFLQTWFYFAGGALCYWSAQKLISQATFLAYVGAMGLCILGQTAFGLWPRGFHASFTPPALVAGSATLLLLYGAGRVGTLARWGNLRVLQYLGRISYSLYLIHFPIIAVVLRVGYRVTYENRGAALVWLGLALAISVIAAHLLYRGVELPSMRLAIRLKPQPTSAAV